MTEVIGKKGEVWRLDEELRETAIELVKEYTEELEHIELQRVIFARMEGTRVDWSGKCYYIKTPYSIISKYVAWWLGQRGILNLDKIPIIEESDVMDIRYIIVLNTENIMASGGNKQIEKAVIHHELLHIKSMMDGIEEHNIKDFSSILERYGIHWSSGNFSKDKEETS